MTIEEKRKIGIFPKGLTNGFGKKLEISSLFRFSYKGLDTLVDYILHRQHGFSKGVNPWFWSKVSLSLFFF